MQDSVAMPFYPSGLAVYPSPSPLTVHLCSPNLLFRCFHLRSSNSLFPLLVFIFARQSRFSRRLLYSGTSIMWTPLVPSKVS